jgi:hypothetical protein
MFGYKFEIFAVLAQFHTDGLKKSGMPCDRFLFLLGFYFHTLYRAQMCKMHECRRKIFNYIRDRHFGGVAAVVMVAEGQTLFIR